MILYLVRHALAEPRGVREDAERELTPDGVARLRAAAAGLVRLGVEVGALLSSPYPRAWQTALVLTEELGWPAPETLDALAPATPVTACLDSLHERGEDALALVGHQPSLSRLASLLLVGDEARLRIDVRKAGVVCLEAPRLEPGAGLLRWAATPRMLRRLGKAQRR